MEPALIVAVVTAAIGATGTVLGAWVQGRVQRLERENPESRHAGCTKPKRGRGQYGVHPRVSSR